MVFVNPRIADIVAHMPEVVAAIHAERDKFAQIAEGIFASHDNPGGHKITTTDGTLDAFVNLEGPAPLSVELGHWTPGRTSFVEGLHIFGRAIGVAAA